MNSRITLNATLFNDHNLMKVNSSDLEDLLSNVFLPRGKHCEIIFVSSYEYGKINAIYGPSFLLGTGNCLLILYS